MIRSKIAMGFLWILLALVLHVLPGAVGPAHAQGTRKDDIVFNSRGIPLAGATVRVCAMPASGQPCTPLALIYSDSALTQALANPTTTDGLGNYFFYAAPGKYEIEISGPGITTKQLPNIILPNDPSSPTFSGISAFSLSLSGNLTVNGNTTVVGNLASGTLNFTNQSTPPGSAGSGTVNLYTKTADKRLYYKDDTGTELGPLGPGVQANVTNTFTASQNFDADFHTKGPNPYVDVTRYGVRGGTASTTATINANSNQASLASASTFQNGDGVTIYGAGLAQTMTTPGAPTVTPSIARVLTGTGDVINGLTGATTYNYKIIARDIAGGYTAASSAGTTATGAASLGSQSVSIASLARSNATVTVTTSSAHGLPVGCGPPNCPMVIIVSTSDQNFDGWQSVASVPDTTHFTYVGGLTTANGAFASATGGTAYWFNCNHLSWSAVTGAYQYYVYSDRGSPGTFNIVGSSRPSNPANNVFTDGTLYFDDFGSPMMDGFTAFPASIPATAPSVATNDLLTTTIVSGAGSTTLTLAANAGTSVSGAAILNDDAPNIKAAVAATNGLPLYFPSGLSTVINSPLNISGLVSSFVGAGITINDTIFAGAIKWNGQAFQTSNSSGQFSLQSNAQISCNASPCLHLNNVPYVSHLTVNSRGNSQVLFLLDNSGNAGANGTLEYLYFAQNANDKMNIQLMTRSDNSGDGSGVFLDHVNFNSTQVPNGSTATPVFYCDGCYRPVLDKIYISGRGMLFRPVPAGQSILMNWVYDQAATTPVVTVTGNLTTPGLTGSSITINRTQATL
jgi:hypothetical protein